MKVFEIHCNLFIVSPIRLKTYRSVFFFFTRENERARKIWRVAEDLHARVHPIGIARAICPGLNIDLNLTYNKSKLYKTLGF